MKEITLDKEVEKKELSERERQERYEQMMQEGSESPYGKAIKKILQEEIDSLDEDIRKIQVEEMQGVFLKEDDEIEKSIRRMSTRNQILLGVTQVLKNFRSRL